MQRQLQSIICILFEVPSVRFWNNLKNSDKLLPQETKAHFINLVQCTAFGTVVLCLLVFSMNSRSFINYGQSASKSGTDVISNNLISLPLTAQCNKGSCFFQIKWEENLDLQKATTKFAPSSIVTVCETMDPVIGWQGCCQIKTLHLTKANFLEVKCPCCQDWQRQTAVCCSGLTARGACETPWTRKNSSKNMKIAEIGVMRSFFSKSSQFFSEGKLCGRCRFL